MIWIICIAAFAAGWLVARISGPPKSFDEAYQLGRHDALAAFDRRVAQGTTEPTPTHLRSVPTAPRPAASAVDPGDVRRAS